MAARRDAKMPLSSWLDWGSLSLSLYPAISNFYDGIFLSVYEILQPGAQHSPNFLREKTAVKRRDTRYDIQNVSGVRCEKLGRR
jgi:hypothetical protein